VDWDNLPSREIIGNGSLLWRCSIRSPEMRNASIIMYTHASPSELQAPIIEMFCLQKTLVIANLITPTWRKLAIESPQWTSTPQAASELKQMECTPQFGEHADLHTFPKCVLCHCTHANLLKINIEDT
jgi:hypothetical protein